MDMELSQSEGACTNTVVFMNVIKRQGYSKGALHCHYSSLLNPHPLTLIYSFTSCFLCVPPYTFKSACYPVIHLFSILVFCSHALLFINWIIYYYYKKDFELIFAFSLQFILMWISPLGSLGEWQRKKKNIYIYLKKKGIRYRYHEKKTTTT